MICNLFAFINNLKKLNYEFWMLSILTFILISCSIYAQKIYNKEKTIFSLEENISYKKGDSYTNERCVLDAYFPKSKKNLPTLVFFHGGGLKKRR
tara:strand:+ start:1498 stop:1782 length:285 start_codon:yes stop_codon:yes gene_type:complete